MTTSDAFREAAWEKYRQRKLSADDPIGLMHAVLDAFADNAAMRNRIHSYVTAPPDSAERILAFNALVVSLGEP